MPDYYGLLGAGGIFEKSIPGFKPRKTQQTLVEAIQSALGNQISLIAEAGTGTGKTFAYLIPALLSGKKILISSGTRTLQDQLFHRDLPIVRKVLGAPVKTALLKGRSNYICLHRLGLTDSSMDLFITSNHHQDLERINQWAKGTRDGDIADLGSVPEGSPLWQMVTSTVDNCLGQECPEFDRCFVLEARRKAQNADIVVINHHLLLADMLLKEEGFAALLPGVDAVIVDEAHQLPEIASQHFGISFSSQQLWGLLRDCSKEYQGTGSDVSDLPVSLEAAGVVIGDVQKQLEIYSQRTEWGEIEKSYLFRSSLQKLNETVSALRQALEIISEHSIGLKNCYQRMIKLAERLAQFIANNPDDQYIRWVERAGNGFKLILMPMNTASRFHSCMLETGCPWIFLSASLSVNGGFEHFRESLGIDEAEEMLLGSPYDYEHNALLYMPEDMPDVNTAGYTTAVIRAALPIIRSAGGRAFLLFTSHKAMQEAVILIRDLIEFPVLVQGEAPRHRLLEKFRELGNAVLLGTASFWEGVDVKGPALSVVMIDRLPFASPSDPIIRARLNMLEQQGRVPFIDYQLPQAVLALKQGVGRLIRDDTDRGVLMLCDPRIISRGYGKVFLDSLPPMRRTRNLTDVTQFLTEILPLHMQGMR